jgi:tellurite resistance protein
MTPSEKSIAKSLIVVAWADGKYEAPEESMIDALLWAFGASEAEEAELREFASKKRKLKDDIPFDDLNADDRQLLLAHAALLTHADGKQTKAEVKVLDTLIELLGFPEEAARPIIDKAAERATKLAEKLRG